jgi:hypothetical protein
MRRKTALSEAHSIARRFSKRVTLTLSYRAALWQHHLQEDEETHLLVIESPYRSLTRPLLAYIDTMHERHPEDTLTVILPEFVVAHWWEYLLHNQTAFGLKAALLFRPGIVVTDVPQHLRDRAEH